VTDGVSRVPVARVLAGGRREEGGSATLFVLGDEWGIDDFRGPDGELWSLPPGAHYDIEFSLPFSLPGVHTNVTPEVVVVDERPVRRLRAMLKRVRLWRY
jgi:hypothetical protein